MKNKSGLLTFSLAVVLLSGSFSAYTAETVSFIPVSVGLQAAPETDTTPPLFTGCPSEPVDLGCNPPAVSEKKAIADAGDVTDDSGDKLKLSAEAGEIAGDCQKTQTWNVTAVDKSGNKTTCQVTYKWIEDKEPPVVSLTLPDIWVECSMTPVIPLPEVTDNCDDDLAFTYTDEIIHGTCNNDKGNLPASGNALKRDFQVEGTGITANLLRSFQLSFEVNQGKGRAEFTLVSPAGEAVILIGPYCEGGDCDWPAPSHKPVYQPVFSSSGENPVWNNMNPIPEGKGYFRPYGGGADDTPNEGYLAQEVPRFKGTYVSSFDQLKGPMDGTWTLYCRKNDNVNGEIKFAGACMIPKCPEEYTIIRTWTITDDCGNYTTVKQNIHITDNTPPVITLPAGDLTMECYNPAEAEAWIATASAMDACTGEVTVSATFTAPADNCDQTVVVTFTATDNCGNTAVETKFFRVADTTPPLLSGVPEDFTLECDQIPAVLPPGSVTAIDNCDADVPVVYEQTRVDGECPNSFTLLRTWTATDDCGNVVSSTQTITMVDTKAPVLAGVPEDYTMECDGILAVLPPGSVTATDNCDQDVPVLFDQVRIDGDCPDNYTLLRTWTATDDCGNQVSALQTITVVDTTAPILSGVPEDYTMECDEIPSVLPPGSVTATDNCDKDVPVLFDQVRIDGDCPDNYTLLRTWTATDDCGNQVSALQTITVVDTTPPVLAGVPSDNTQECSMLALEAFVTATDNCDPAVSVTMEVLESDFSKGCGKLVRKWTATDLCGNSVSAVQTVTIVDNKPPVLECPPDTELTLPAGAQSMVWDNPDPEVTDNCTGTESITLSGVRSDGKPLDDPWSEGLFTITWTAVDLCGNLATCVQTVTVRSACLTVDAWVYLEGAAVDPEGTSAYTLPMRTGLNDLRILPGQTLVDPIFGSNYYTPAGQPYNMPPWNYTGTEGSSFDSEGNPDQADAGYPSTVTDWVLVSLRSDVAGASGPVYQAAALLHNDGHIQFPDNFEFCGIDKTIPYYLVVEHRNHLIIMSQEPVLPVSNVITYDFRNKQSYIDPLWGPAFYVGQKEILPGVFAMYAGNGDQKTDLNSDTDLDFNDRSAWEADNRNFGRFLTGDYNLNGDTNFNDRFLWEYNNSKFTSVPR